MGSSLKSFLSNHHRAVFYGMWFLLLLVPATGTELFDDEAYYWIYSQSLDWGYFDHPPVIALLIRAGYGIFHSELGVRLFTVIFSVASIALIERLIERKNPLLFYAICSSLALAQIGGMLAVPDTALMFLVALFFYQYQRFRNSPNLSQTLKLSLVIALMLYTKYHGLLIVMFTIMSDPGLLRQPRFYVTACCSILLFAPHIYWQYQNGFPSVQYHLFERNAADYDFGNTLEYIGGQIALAGPLTGWLLIGAALLYRPSSQLEKALKYTLVGVYIFFLVSTAKGKSEANWTVPAFVGLIVLSHQFLLTSPRLRKILYRTVPLTIVLVLAAKCIMVVDMPPSWWLVKDEFHGNRTWAETIQKKAAGNPVVFMDSYQRPSKYRFYTGDTALALNTVYYRRNNYNFWKFEDSLIGRPAYVVGSGTNPMLTDTLDDIRLRNVKGTTVPYYYSFSRIMIDDIECTPKGENKFTIGFHTLTPPNFLTHGHRAPADSASIYLAIYRKLAMVAFVPTNVGVRDLDSTSQYHRISVGINLYAGKYTAKFCISNCLPGQPSLNSSAFDLVLK